MRLFLSSLRNLGVNGRLVTDTSSMVKNTTEEQKNNYRIKHTPKIIGELIIDKRSGHHQHSGGTLEVNPSLETASNYLTTRT